MYLVNSTYLQHLPTDHSMEKSSETLTLTCYVYARQRSNLCYGYSIYLQLPPDVMKSRLRPVVHSWSKSLDHHGCCVDRSNRILGRESRRIKLSPVAEVRQYLLYLTVDDTILYVRLEVHNGQL